MEPLTIGFAISFAFWSGYHHAKDENKAAIVCAVLCIITAIVSAILGTTWN